MKGKVKQKIHKDDLPLFNKVSYLLSIPSHIMVKKNVLKSSLFFIFPINFGLITTSYAVQPDPAEKENNLVITSVVILDDDKIIMMIIII